jgi:predicted polyphosphate/ATP-dependent NAD kinase
VALKIGLIVNPLAGMGGSLGMKGSDSNDLRLLAIQQNQAKEVAALSRSMGRALRAFALLTETASDFEIVTCSGAMGQWVLDKLGLDYQLINERRQAFSTADNTQAAAIEMESKPIDILVFAGGDGTARDIYDSIGQRIPVLGIPAGVKMHSGVFVVSPEAAGELLIRLATGGLVGLSMGEVRDIDEAAFQAGVVRSSFYGEMSVPGEGHYLQRSKIGGRESPELAAADIAAWVVEDMEDHVTYLLGPGSTTAAIAAELGLTGTLLGVDVIRRGELIAADANEEILLKFLGETSGKTKIIVTVIPGQGHVFGRGNQQFSPAVIRAVGLDNICIVAAKSKITELGRRPLLVDTNDRELDLALSGYRRVITGYRDQILYRVAA